ncbi:tctex1 domain-containing protein 1-A-like [Actinia tenebrosa]|uniref:Tctex1 domain-containing protein 1-A-like n=1 Tax=Actinia tenebrosa TaxID=6105 RepID=A0A6P8IBJ1_ACTTE|nr:tctex1 domain-containing protein 1-A-like [Actinia tenebrosa]
MKKDRSMSEKSNFTKPLSAALGKATGVFTRPKLQRRAFTAHAASELISAASLSSVLLDLRENGTKSQDKIQTEQEKPEVIDDAPNVLISHRLSTCHGNGTGIVDSKTKTEGNVHEPRRNSDTAVSNNPQLQNNKFIAKDKDFTSLNCFRVKNIISETLKAHVGNMEYDHQECGEKSRVMSQIIEKRVKTLSNAQYKVTVMVFIGAIRDKGIELATQCVWSPAEDYFAMATHKNETVFASAIVFATIFE